MFGNLTRTVDSSSVGIISADMRTHKYCIVFIFSREKKKKQLLLLKVGAFDCLFGGISVEWGDRAQRGKYQTISSIWSIWSLHNQNFVRSEIFLLEEFYISNLLTEVLYASVNISRHVWATDFNITNNLIIGWLMDSYFHNEVWHHKNLLNMIL